MKAIKISVSAILLSSLSFSALNAVSLEEAIKDVEVKGLARYRFYGESDVPFFGSDKQVNRFTGALDIIAKIDDNLKFGTTLMVDRFDNAQNEPSASGNAEVRRFWFQYFNNDFDVKLGKLRIVTPWTNYAYAGTHGNGAVVQYTGFNKLMFVGGYFNQVNGFNQINKFISPNIYGGEDLFYIGAIANINYFTIQAWANRMTNMIDVMAYFDVNFRYENLRLRAQTNYAKLADEQKNLFADDDGIFYGFEAEYKTDRFFVNIGYTKTDNDMPIYVFAADNNDFIQFGDTLQLIYKGANLADAKLIFIKSGVNFNKLGLEAGYGHIDVGQKDMDMDEYYAKASYKMNKSFTFTTFYSILDSEEKNKDNNRLYFDLAYFF